MIFPVTFAGSWNRVAPTKTTDVGIVALNIPRGAAIDVDIAGSGGANGTATIVAGNRLTGTGTVTVKGGTQTTPGNAGKLAVRAKLGAREIGRSMGFTVAAFPIKYTDPFDSDIDTPGAVGVRVQDGWESDGSGAIAELDQVEISERVDIQSRDNPPFTTAGGTSATSGTSTYQPGNSLTKDSHTYGRAGIHTAGLAAGGYTLVYGQLCIFKCHRTGVTDAVMPDSGFKITHKLVHLSFLPRSLHQTTKRGAAVTVEGRTATAGVSNADSLIHAI